VTYYTSFPADFQVGKALIALLKNSDDTFNDVLRRVLDNEKEIPVLDDIHEEMALALANAAIWLRGYEANHRAKGTHESTVKAETNARRAKALEELVDRYREA
jgi:hypothetical protein